MKNCPHCAESIQDEAKVCRYCQRDLNPLAAPIPRPEPAGNKAWLIAVVIGFLMSTFYSGGLLGPGGIGFFVMWIGIALASSSTPVARWGGGFLVALLLMIPGFVLAYNDAMGSLSPSASVQRDIGDQIELLASRGFQSSDSYKRVDGQVKNLTSDAFRSVTAVVSWFDKDDRFISSDSALVEYRPLLPGQTSPFSVLVASNPEMKSFRVEFTVSGKALTVRRSDLK